MRRLLVLVMVSSCSGPERPVVHVDVAATCADVTGAGEVRRAGRPYWEPLRRGSTLRNGDWVRTRAGTTAHLELMAGGRLDLSESAVVVIEPPELPGPAVAAKGPSIGIEEGEVRATLATADGSLRIRRGTGETKVLESPAVYRLSAGTDAGIEVQRLDAAPPEVTVVDAGVPRATGPAPATFSWQAQGGGSSYRVMVSKGVDPQRAPVFNQVTSAAQATAPALQPGTYTWGVYEEGAVLRPLFLKPRKLVVRKK